MINLKNNDIEIFETINKELLRQQEGIELIASENYVSESVLEAAGSILTNKYAEGYSSKRYYGGCENIDIIENIANDRLKKLFNAQYSNVQPHSGANANMAVYFALLNIGDTVLGMDLSNGGHLTHGSKVNFSGKNYNFISYGLDEITETLDYDKILELAQAHKPKLIVAGASAYSRKIDFKKFREIADSVGAYLMVDMAHIAGIVAAGLHQNPCEYADVVTTTTHKTLRGPRGGAILCKEELGKKIDSAVFPGIQGGPLEHIIAAKAVCFKEASTLEFKEYQMQVLKNSKILAEELMKKGFKLVSNGTDNHLILINFEDKLTGKEAENLLSEIKITVNKNSVPNDKRSPFITSGIRVGTAAITTRGFKEDDMIELADIIAKCLFKLESSENLLNRVYNLTAKYPIYKNL